MEQNLLIVDDELEIVSWLEEMFRYDFDREIGVYTAQSGKAALDLLNRVRFDVVLTDVHMPRMDGITLFRKVKENWPRCRTVFLTGYQDFDDVYQVFQYRDVKYVLKSETDAFIKQAVGDAFVEIEAELEKERLLRIQEERLLEASLWMQRSFMQEVLNGNMAAAKVLCGAGELELKLDIRREMLAFLLRPDIAIEDEWKENLLEKLASLLAENIPEKLLYHIHIQEKRYLFLMLQPKAEEDRDWECIKAVGLGAVEYTQKMFESTYEVTFSAVVKGDPVSLGQLSEAAVRLKQAMIGYVGKNCELILQEELLEWEDAESPRQNMIIQVPMLKSYLELGKQKEYYALLTGCMDVMRERTRHDVYALEIYYSIATLLLQFINENHMYMQLAFKTGLYKLMKADEHAGWPEAERFLGEVSGAIFELLGDKENTLTERALARVIQYIEEHLSEDLPLKTLAEAGGFNASYLSRLFKQTCDQTLTEYIRNKRMEKAKKLLAETDEKILAISAKTGYLSSQSFARTFRSCMGVSPQEYRELHYQRRE